MQYNKITIVDEENNVIGAEYMMDAIKEGHIRRASRVFVFNTSGQLLLQRRSRNVLKSLLLDQSAAGHVDEGETYEEAAYREFEEELGISDVSLELVATSIRTSDFFNAIYRCTIEDGRDINYEKEEIDEVLWYDIATLERELEEHPERFTNSMQELWPQYKNIIIGENE